MRIIAVTLILTVAACASVQTRTERNSGIGFDNFEVPTAGGNQPVEVHL